MPNKKDKKLTAKQQSFIEYYCNPKSETYNNAVQSYLKANYAKCTGYRINAQRLLTKDYIKQAISDYRAENKLEIEYNYKIAMKQLDDLISKLDDAISKGNLQAVQIKGVLLREKNDITGLHKQTIHSINEDKKAISEVEQIEARRMASIRLRENIA